MNALARVRVCSDEFKDIFVCVCVCIYIYISSLKAFFSRFNLIFLFYFPRLFLKSSLAIYIFFDLYIYNRTIFSLVILLWIPCVYEILKFTLEIA